MAVFGLTGNTSSGKTTLIGLLKRKGAKILSADLLVHQFYRNKKSPVYKKISCIFPDAVLKG